MKQNPDYELEVLLSLDGYEFRFASGYAVKYQARRVSASAGRPHGIKYILTFTIPTAGRFTVSTTRTKRGGAGNLILASISVERAGRVRVSRAGHLAGRLSAWS
jgi:hypothetical protein